MSELKLGDKLYRYVEVGGVFTYTVIALRVTEFETAYEVRCETCTHGWKCEMVIGNSDGNLVYRFMTNDDEDSNRQNYWHNDRTVFHTDINLAKIDAYKNQNKYWAEKISKLEDALKLAKEERKKVDGLIAAAKGEAVVMA
jgi:hypothetical protein